MKQSNKHEAEPKDIMVEYKKGGTLRRDESR